MVACMALCTGLCMVSVACASIGRPEGGPRDETPPVFIKSNPAPGTTRFNGDRIDVTFDENIKVEDIMNKVVISPAQKQMPTITANGRRLTIQLKDSLSPNTTYTLDFSDAIRDLNEGNILDGFAMDFSTGDSIDTLRISGMVLQASNLEPAQGMLVGVYDNLADSAITTLPMVRIAKTNQLGQFTVRNLRPGTYNIFAINDVNRDYRRDASENVAFYPVPVTPSVEKIVVTDTLRNAAGKDSLVTRDGIRYLPNDILLTWFSEPPTKQYLRDYARPDSNHIVLKMGATPDSLPRLTVVNGVNKGRRIDAPTASRLEHSASRDSLVYWIADRALMRQDSLLVAVDYRRTDSLDRPVWASDTLKFFYKAPKQPKAKKKKSEATDSVAAAPKMQFLDVKMGSTSQEVNLPIEVTFNAPIDSLDPTAWHLAMQVDTVWKPIATPRVQPDTTGRILSYKVISPWEPGTKYRLTVDSASIHSIYGLHNKPLEHEFQTVAAEDYSTLTFKLKGLPDSVAVIVQVLDNSDKPVASAPVINGRATIPYLKAGTYYARAFVDNDSNGEWTTGNLAKRLLPEDVYYFDKKIKVKKNWDFTNDWDLNALPVDQQKPIQIKKNKPKLKNREQSTPAGDDEEEEFDPMNPGGMGGNRMGGNRMGNNRNGLNTMGRSDFGGLRPMR